MGWARGSVTRTLPVVGLFAYISYVFELMEPSDARLILFDTSLHSIDTDSADLRSRSKIEFLHYSICIEFLCYNVLSVGGGIGRGYTWATAHLL